ncbi:hypothetical protein [Frigoriflavimonas asaccharolytica]|uniref:Uncharacterized protein n=1 Tax=Frigoriflavimonas asaccharolytica TaxID=2735899 RepID=A0A8J8K928_9FLAO|nr:hypothetical protein [Frigoriflavimonas asaccharolytica]NRS93166.1 hypothetical protein [Frigoriflavimonas asaccharolytica]
MRKSIIIIALFISSSIYSQVAIGKTTTTNNSVSVEFGTGNKGIILPWVSSQNSVTNAVLGTVIYDAADFKIKVKLNASWKDFSIDGNGFANTTLQDALTDVPTAKTVIGSNANTDTTAGILVLSDTNKAMILPIVADAHLNIPNPSPGMMVYDPNTKQFAVFNGTVWSFWTGI